MHRFCLTNGGALFWWKILLLLVEIVLSMAEDSIVRGMEPLVPSQYTLDGSKCSITCMRKFSIQKEKTQIDSSRL